MSSGSTQSIKQYSDSESDASELSDDELDRLEREIRRNNHPVKNSIVSFRESSVSVFLKSFFAKAEEKEDNDNEINANDERNNLNKTTTSYSIALTRGQLIMFCLKQCNGLILISCTFVMLPLQMGSPS